MTRWLFAIAFLVGCGAPAAPKPVVGAGPVLVAKPVAKPVYLAGAKVPLDYRADAARDAKKCAAGCGDLAACRALFDLAIHARGTVPRVDDVATLTRMCKRGEAQACQVGVWLGSVDAHDAAGPLEDTDDRCAGGDASACEIVLGSTDFDGMRLSVQDDPPREQEPTEAEITEKRRDAMVGTASALCRRGMTEACVKMVAREMRSCTADDTDCRAAVIADRRARGIDPAPFVFAWDRVQRACRDNDADACALIPGREPSQQALCDAGDYVACAALGAAGDPRARAIACAAGVGTSCTPPRAEGTAEAVANTVRDLGRRCDIVAHDAAACRAIAPLRSPPACPATK